ncbi:MAG: DNA polymerase domain-containing protein [Nitrososphaeraceae archaeon]
MVEGWIFDVYPLQDRMVIWIKKKNGNLRLEDSSWKYCLYVAADDKSELLSLLGEEQIMKAVEDYEFVLKYERLSDAIKKRVLKLSLKEGAKALKLARQIESFGRFHRFRLYNVDLLPAQYYFYDKDLFPLAFCYFDSKHPSNLEVKDNVCATDYWVPDFKSVHLTINLKKEGKIAKPGDMISSIVIQLPNERIEIQKESEVSTIQELMEDLNTKIDPDFVFTDDGDSFTFPHLIHRADVNGIPLIMSRESIALKKPDSKGSSYISYGKVYFKPTTTKLLGRIHIDLSDSFFLDEGNNSGGLHGLYEISRLCRMPLHTASRASIGRCLSSLQFYYANKKDILIPWKPTVTEHFKSFEELLIADRGGFIFEPDSGVHEQVAEFDFVSLYPNIMLQKNISAETVHCKCCSQYTLRVPELGYNICEKRTGIVPTGLKIVLDKRSQYKKLRQTCATNNNEIKSIYDARQSALKWILVTSFGYLGFNNAKFGRIDAHIAVCAFDRHIFLQTSKIAEEHGFSIVHGIVDSIWIQKKEAKMEYYTELEEIIEKKIGFRLSFEGIYKWIAFLPSKINSNLPVVNRYFGVFQDSVLKVRGIEARRRDTPNFFSEFQNEILHIIASGNNIKEVGRLIPYVNEHFQKYKQLLKEDKSISLEDLAFSKRRSKDLNEYQINRNTIENDAMRRLNKEGRSLIGGQILRYIITDYRGGKRSAIPLEIIDENTTYDKERYTELLVQICNSVIEPFGYTVSIDNHTS